MDGPITTKTCSKCGQEKGLEEFSRRGDNKSKYRSACKPCRSKEGMEHAAKNREGARRRARRWRERHPEYTEPGDKTARNRKFRSLYPEKSRARSALRAAVKAGRVTKPSVCQECLTPLPPHLIHGHHEDYSKQLDVVWLCRDCHMKRHRYDD